MSLFKAVVVISLMSFPISAMGQTLPITQETESADRSASE